MESFENQNIKSKKEIEKEEEKINEKYRFGAYGDAMLII